MQTPIEVHPGIFVYEDFLTPDEVSAIVALGESISLDGWRLRGADAPSVDSLPFAEDLKERMYEIFDETAYVVRTFNKLQRREFGDTRGLSPHYALQHEDTRCYMSAIIIVNDDYEGGELEFVDQGFTIKPKAGSIIVFPPSQEYRFNITSITSESHRYSIPENIFYKEEDQPERR